MNDSHSLGGKGKPTAEERLVKWCADHYVAPTDRYELIDIFSAAEQAVREPLHELLNACDVHAQRGYTYQIRKTDNPLMPYEVVMRELLDTSEEHVLSLEREVERLKSENKALYGGGEQIAEEARAEGYREGMEEAAKHLEKMHDYPAAAAIRAKLDGGESET